MTIPEVGQRWAMAYQPFGGTKSTFRITSIDGAGVCCLVNVITGRTIFRSRMYLQRGTRSSKLVTYADGRAYEEPPARRRPHLTKRAVAAVACLSGGTTEAEIARHHKVSVATVKRWVQEVAKAAEVAE
jgi:DNA-binding NarL/FixJ family response regulator